MNGAGNVISSKIAGRKYVSPNHLQIIYGLSSICRPHCEEVYGKTRIQKARRQTEGQLLGHPDSDADIGLDIRVVVKVWVCPYRSDRKSRANGVIIAKEEWLHL